VTPRAGLARHAEVVGGGFGGLAAAAALLARGWSVRVHERTPFVRAEGYGIAIHENGLRVLEALGVREQVQARGLRVTRLVSRDARDRTVADVAVPGSTFRLERQAIVEALAERVLASGGQIATGSAVRSVDPGGAVVLEDGSVRRADLVVVADGIHSRCRDALGLLATRRLLADGALRLVVPRIADEVDAGAPDGAAVVEYWSGTRRVIYSPVDAQDAYLALSCLERDAAGRQVPLDLGSWRAGFPHLAALFDTIERHADWSRVYWQRFQVVRLRRWSAGRVAVLGDAAHAMPPNLGQGAGCALMNALSLAAGLDGTPGDAPNMERALTAWEARERPLTEHVQRWSALYGRATAWPEWARSAFFGLTQRSAYVRRQMQRAQRHVPAGTQALGAS
jgi:2-polyprenyl-6-methoxyphenol hydroxylase-like FAD-dependent oxidoreductase